MKRLLLVALAMLAATHLEAQVGVPPERSPFRDIENRMDVSLVSGAFIGGGDPVGVAPKSGTYVGARYEFSMGLIGATGRLGLAPTKRAILDPTAPEGSRITGEVNSSLVLLDAGFTIGLTGRRTFHNLAPYFGVGLGFATDLELADAHGYDLGPRFMFTLGAGMKWLFGSTWQVRLDATDHIFRVSYPSSYFLSDPGEMPVRIGDESVSTHNLIVTVGLSYRFFR